MGASKRKDFIEAVQKIEEYISDPVVSKPKKNYIFHFLMNKLNFKQKYRCNAEPIELQDDLSNEAETNNKRPFAAAVAPKSVKKKTVS